MNSDNNLHTKSDSHQEKIEKSWEFLYNISNEVLKNFSKESKNQVHELGEILSKAGMKYLHVIDFGEKKIKSLSKSQEKSSTLQKSV